MTREDLQHQMLHIAAQLLALARSIPDVEEVRFFTVMPGPEGMQWIDALQNLSDELKDLSCLRNDHPGPPGPPVKLETFDAALAKAYPPERMQELCDQPRPELAMVKRAGDDE